jgi:predicted nucleotidyltransferase component of viral defense system
MINEFIQNIVREEKMRGSNQLYIRTAIKEYLQILVLNFIYGSNKYRERMIFTGGTCLRHFFGLDRLSEDLDFDRTTDIDVEELKHDVATYFKEKLHYQNLDLSIKQKGGQLLLKFPVLREIGLANESESDFLYIKSDIADLIGTNYKVEKTSKGAFGYNFVATHYNLSSLFAGKLSALILRNLLTGENNTPTIKGRDFYDLLWFLKKNVPVNLDLVRERVNQQELTLDELQSIVDEKVGLACGKYKNDFKNDLLPFIPNSDFTKNFVENYFEEYKRYPLFVE